ncbi:MAG: lysoplasmalogenase [Anditalea sp.]
MDRKNIIWLYIYMIAGIIDLALITQNQPDYRYISKPLILLSLTIYFIKGSYLIKGTFLRKSVGAALVFSLMGDILFLFPHLFIFGIGAFLMVHICYILAFKLAQDPLLLLNKLYFIKLFLYNLPIYILAAILYFIIHYQLLQMEIPVVIYLCAIVLMVTTARERYKRTNDSSFWQVFLGAALFFISHGIYLIHLFFQPIADADILMMGAYLLAQLLMVMGLRSHYFYVIQEKIKESKSS